MFTSGNSLSLTAGKSEEEPLRADLIFSSPFDTETEHKYLVPGGGGESGALCLLPRSRPYKDVGLHETAEFLNRLLTPRLCGGCPGDGGDTLGPRDPVLPAAAHASVLLSRAPHRGPITASRLSPRQPHWQFLNPTDSAIAASVWSPS